jgi:hypothetical protein
MGTFKRDSIDVVKTALENEKESFVTKIMEVYPDQSKGILVMHYNAINKKYALNDNGSIINIETKQLLTQAKTEWVNEEESQEEGVDEEEVKKPVKQLKEKTVKTKAKEPKVKKEKVLKEPKAKRVLKYGEEVKKFNIGDKVAFFANGVENTGEVTRDFFRDLSGVKTEIVFIKNDDETKNVDKKDKSNIVNAKRVRLIDGEYEAEFKEKKEKTTKSVKSERVLKYSLLDLKFVKGDKVAFKMRNGEEGIGIVQASFNRIMKKQNGESEIFNHVCIDVNGIPNYKKSVYVRAFPDGVYEEVPVKNSGRKKLETISDSNEKVKDVENSLEENVFSLDEIERKQELVEA